MYMYVFVAPSPIDVDSIEIMQLHNKNIKITWKVCKYIPYNGFISRGANFPELPK